eukprot:3282652-Rhodomonas_salina.1
MPASHEWTRRLYRRFHCRPSLRSTKQSGVAGCEDSASDFPASEFPASEFPASEDAGTASCGGGSGTCAAPTNHCSGSPGRYGLGRHHPRRRWPGPSLMESRWRRC